MKLTEKECIDIATRAVLLETSERENGERLDITYWFDMAPMLGDDAGVHVPSELANEQSARLALFHWLHRHFTN